ncbi:MAG: alpha/beta hydrolase [Rikenellaceae bacterium]|jgi:acetyl esterase/lipase|nr:alpha/beta hydrolase [Rikenellaceae bacterium]
MKNLLLCCALLLSVGNLAAQPPQGGFNFPDIPEATPSPLAESLDFREAELTPIAEGAVEVIKNVVYAERDGMELHTHIIYPKNAVGSLPCIIYVPGSAWFKQNIDMSLPNMERFAARGYVVALVEYRPSTVAHFPAQAEDAKTATRFMRKNAERYHVDTDNVFAWGDSSGGHTALLLGYTSGVQSLDTDLYGDYSDKVNAVVDYYGPADLVTIAAVPNVLNPDPKTSPEAVLIGSPIADNIPEARRASPVDYATAHVPPTLVAHGNKDFVVPMSQSNEMAEALDKARANYVYYCLLGGGHGSREFWTDPMFDIVDAFLQSHLNK